MSKWGKPTTRERHRKHTELDQSFSIRKRVEVALVCIHRVSVGVRRDDDRPGLVGLKQRVVAGGLEVEIREAIVDEVDDGPRRAQLPTLEGQRICRHDESLESGVNTGPFRRWHAGAELHRLHHRKEPGRGDVNFGLFTTLGDRILGTLDDDLGERLGPGDLGIGAQPDYRAAWTEQMIRPFRLQRPRHP